MFKNTLLWIGKVTLCGLTYYVGTILGGMLASGTGLPAPPIPEGADAATLGLLMLIGSFLFAGALAFVARGLAAGFLYRWPALASLTWVAYSLNNYLEASIYAPDAGSSFQMIVDLVASLLSGAAVAWLFPSPATGRSIRETARAFFAGRSVGQWGWRSLAALAVFPAIYFLCGTLVSPFILDYYRQQQFGLTLPSWGQIIPLQFLRSLIFLLACLPLLIAWHRSWRSLFITLGLTLFLLVGGVPLLMAYWYPPIMRVLHGVEILADSLVHAGALVLLLVWRTSYLEKTSYEPSVGPTGDEFDGLVSSAP